MKVIEKILKELEQIKAENKQFRTIIKKQDKRIKELENSERNYVES